MISKFNENMPKIQGQMSPWGPSIKYVTFDGEGVQEGVTVCDRGRGPKACDVTL